MTIMWLTSMVIFLAAGTSASGNPAGGSVVYDQRQSGKMNVRLDVKDALIIAVGDGELGGDYDYSYDYSDLTIKPPPAPPSTKEPSTTNFPETAGTVVTTAKTTTAKVPSTTYVTFTTSKNTVSSGLMKTSSAPTFNYTKAPILLEAENNSIIFPSKNPENGSSETFKLPLTPRPGQIPALVLQELLGSLPYKFLPAKSSSPNASSSGQTFAKPVSLGAAAINPETLPRRNCSPGYFLDNHNRCKRIVPKPSKS